MHRDRLHAEISALADRHETRRVPGLEHGEVWKGAEAKAPRLRSIRLVVMLMQAATVEVLAAAGFYLSQ